MLEVNNLCKRFGNTQALDGLNFQIREGELFGFVGPNGAGKTTAIKIITGLLKPDSGEVYIDGMNGLKNYRRMKRKIGYMPDFFGVYDNLKVWEYMEFFSAAHGIEGLKARKKYMELLDIVGLLGKYDHYVDGLSRGMKQKLCLAQSMLHDPKLLILDEPASGLDPGARREFKTVIRQLHQQGRTILISSHILSDLGEMCTDIGIIKGGKMVLHGRMDELTERLKEDSPLEITVCENMETAVAILRQEEMVLSLSCDDSHILAMVRGDARMEAKLLERMVEAGVKISSFHRKTGNLESLFIEITNPETGGDEDED